MLDAVTILAKYAGLTSDEAAAIALLKRVGGATTETAMKGMAGTGTRVTQAEVGPLERRDHHDAEPEPKLRILHSQRA